MSEVLEVKSPTKERQAETKTDNFKAKQQIINSSRKVEHLDPLLHSNHLNHTEHGEHGKHGDHVEHSEDVTAFVNDGPDCINHTINMASLGPGAALKTAREEAKLSKEDVAKELRLAVRHIDHLEQDAYYKFSATAFYIGYVRSYAKLLDLDPDKMIAKFYAIHKNTLDVPKHKNPVISSKEKFLINTLHKTVSKTRQIFENSLTPKFFKIAVVIIVSLSLIFWLFSTPDNLKTSVTSGSDTVVSELNPGDNAVTNLPPERVDELLPTSPVIVKNVDNFDDTALQNGLAFNENKNELELNVTTNEKYG